MLIEFIVVQHASSGLRIQEKKARHAHILYFRCNRHLPHHPFYQQLSYAGSICYTESEKQYWRGNIVVMVGGGGGGGGHLNLAKVLFFSLKSGRTLI